MGRLNSKFFIFLLGRREQVAGSYISLIYFVFFDHQGIAIALPLVMRSSGKEVNMTQPWKGKRCSFWFWDPYFSAGYHGLDTIVLGSESKFVVSGSEPIHE